MRLHRNIMKPSFFTVVICWLALVAPISAQEGAKPQAARVPIIFDTDLGSDIGDAFALALILASPELELRGVTTVSGDTQVRALMACRFLTMTGRRHTPVAAGAAPQPPQEIVRNGQYRYYYHPDVLFNRTTRPVKESAVEFMYSRLKADPGKITIIAAGPLTNIARLLTEKPDAKGLIKQIVASEPSARADKLALQKVSSSKVPMIWIPSVEGLKLDDDGVKRVFAPRTALSLQVEALYQLWDRSGPVLGDAFAVASCIDNRFTDLWKHAADEPSFNWAVEIRSDAFLKWYVERMANCVAPATRPAKPVAQGAMPHRVHVAEDFDNDIERFWWMSGKEEHKNLPAGSKRACRGTLTHDFDDLLGHTKAMYTAVVFNPVPGPPMDKNPRLSFRYWLKGTDTLRVQIYSLTNGYHRHLVLTGLPQRQWQQATVDMTQARRPDGTGGPLSEGERIDDIQLYTDPGAELIADDFVLFDAAVPGEKRPFPKRIIFTGGFDSGKQGKQWPGTFDIVEGGYFWKAAKSVAGPDGKPWLRIHLRGERHVGATAEVFFRYKLTGGKSIKVRLVKGDWSREQELTGSQQDRWAGATARFDLGPKDGWLEEIHFLLEQGAELLVDDLLLYEPDETG